MGKKVNRNLSIDIGATKIRVIIYDHKFTVKEAYLFKTEDFFKGKIVNLENFIFYLSKKLKENIFSKIGISINCYIVNNKILYSSLLGGRVKLDLKQIVKKYFSFSYFFAENDVVCAAKAEISFGWGIQYKNFSYINIGSGVRVVNVYHHHLFLGSNNLAGEISGLKIYHPQFKLILFEQLLGGKYLSSIYRNYLKNINHPKDYFKNIDFVKSYFKNFAFFIVLVNHFYDPQAIVLGGSVTQSIRKNFKFLKDAMNNLDNNLFKRTIKFSKIKFPESIGALLK